MRRSGAVLRAIRKSASTAVPRLPPGGRVRPLAVILAVALLAVPAALAIRGLGRPALVSPPSAPDSPTPAATEGASPAGSPKAMLPGEGAERIQLVAVQMRWRLEDYATAERFAARVEGLLQQAAARLDPSLPTLVVFPEDVGILTALVGEGDALGGATTLQEAVERLARRHLPAVLWQRTRHGVSWPRAIFLARHEVMARTYFETFSAAARRHRVYLVAGSIPLPDYDLPPDGSLPRSYRPRGTAVHNVSYVFGPDGRILGRQKKVHLLDIEGPAGLDLVPGRPDELRVIPTPLGRLGVAICLDAFKDDVLDRLAAQGADILVQPSANPAPWSPEQQADWLNGSWRAVASPLPNGPAGDGQGSAAPPPGEGTSEPPVGGGAPPTGEGAGAPPARRFAYAVNPMMGGRVLNLGFYGQSAIFARPRPAAPGGPGSPDAGPGGSGAPESGPGGSAALGYAATGPRPGFLAVAPTAEEEAVLVVTVPRPRK